MATLARFLLILGIVFLFMGGVLYLVSRTGFTLGRLPGDLRLEKGNFTCVFALGTSLLLSVILTLVLNLIIRLFNR